MTIERARRLRIKATYYEKVMWLWLRNRQFGSFKFRRQQVLGYFIVDFVCFEKRLIIELDGPYHAEQKEYDARRDRWLESQGFRILRIPNEELMNNEKAVMERIRGLLDH